MSLVIYPHPVLRSRAQKVREIDDHIRRLVEEMFRVMEEKEGIGLAAPQVGEPKRVIVLHLPDEDEVVLINPVIVSKVGKCIDVEGCLSLPGVEVEVPRAEEVVVEGMDLDGNMLKLEKNGLWARALQHEVDHLNGRLIIDYLKGQDRLNFEMEWEKLLKKEEG